MVFQAFKDYLLIERRRSMHTVMAYVNDLKDFREFLNREYDGMDIAGVNYPIIRAWTVHLVNSGLSHRTVNRKMSSLKTYYRFLLKTKQLEINPMAGHQALKTEKNIQIPFSETEISNVLELLRSQTDFNGLRDLLMVELFYSTGIRRAELINIRVSDFNETDLQLKVLGKRNKERIIPLLPAVSETFTQYMKVRETLPETPDADYLFLTEKGRKIYGTLVYRVINTYFSQVSEKIKRSPHILRHSFATHLLNEGANINAVKELLGHSSLASTQVYAQTGIERLKEVYRKSHPRN